MLTFNYLVLSEGVDNEEFRNDKSMEEPITCTVIKLDKLLAIIISSSDSHHIIVKL